MHELLLVIGLYLTATVGTRLMALLVEWCTRIVSSMRRGHGYTGSTIRLTDALVCPQCSARQPLTAKFCDQCSTALPLPVPVAKRESALEKYQLEQPLTLIVAGLIAIVIWLVSK